MDSLALGLVKLYCMWSSEIILSSIIFGPFESPTRTLACAYLTTFPRESGVHKNYTTMVECIALLWLPQRNVSSRWYLKKQEQKMMYCL
jgi:hypothetical protein